MSDRKLRIGVAGATGAVGREIVALLHAVDLPIGTIVPMASPACRTHSVDVGSGSVRVENMLSEVVATCDLVFFAVPPAAAVGAIDDAMEHGVPIIDLTGTLGSEQGVPTVVPVANRMLLEGFREQLAVASPRPEVVALATLLAPCRAHAGDLRCRGLVMHSASLYGRDGVEELSNQVVSLFNNRTPQRAVFAQGLAFDLWPAVGQVGHDGWTDHELRSMGQLAQLLRLPPQRLALTCVLGPWFNGLCLSLQIETDAGLDAAQLEAVMEAAPDLELVRSQSVADLPRPRGVDGRLTVQVGRLRDDPAGHGVHLWAAADELRFGAAGNAVAILAALIEDDLL